MRFFEASPWRFPSLLHARGETTGVATQRSRPSVLHLRTGVRIPPPPDFARALQEQRQPRKHEITKRARRRSFLLREPSCFRVFVVMAPRTTIPALHFVYIVRCADGSLYTGYAIDPQARAEAHNLGRGARYTRGRGPVRLVYLEKCASH